MTKTYTKIKKNDWLKYFRTFHSLYRTRSKNIYSIKKLRSDYKTEL